MFNFNRLVRFEDQKGQVHYGEASIQDAQSDLIGQSLKIYEGSEPWDNDFHLTEDTATISRVRAPAPASAE